MTLTLALRPGEGLGQFSLGSPICEIIKHLKEHRDSYQRVEIKYSEQDSLREDITFSFPEHGFLLRFDPRSQRLRLIEVYDFSRLRVLYAQSIIGGPNFPATFVRLYDLFGPTYPGSFVRDHKLYAVSYPGLLFLLTIPAPYASDLLSTQASEVPVEFPDGTTPVVARAEIHHSQGAPCSLHAVLASPPPPLAAGDCFFQQIRVRLGVDLFFCTSGHELEFGCCPQDAWAQLGAPGDLTYKKVDTMVIHAGHPHGASEFRQDYFYNYYNLGIDILFDGATHHAKKFVLHTNHVGHADFNSYVKCNFVIEDPDCGVPGHDGEGGRNDAITADSTWEEVQRIYGQSGRPAVHMTGAASNPFGPTYFFGYPNVTFEIMRNGHIASVTLFSTAGEGKDAQPADVV